MRVGIMKTDGGPHPADKWATQTAESIGDMIQIDDASQSPAAVTARKAKPRLLLDLADALESHHQSHIDHAKDTLQREGSSRLMAPYDPQSTIHKNALDTVNDILAKSPFAEHFAKDEVVKTVKEILGQHFASSDHIERSWHVDRKADAGVIDEHITAFKDKWHSAPVADVAPAV